MVAVIWDPIPTQICGENSVQVRAVTSSNIWMRRRKPAILLVDDQPAGVMALALGFEDAGCRAFLVSSAEEALKAVLTDAFDGALLDYQMPRMNGLELVERLQLIAGSKAQTWPIWLMTGAPTPAIYQRAAELRVRNVFTKPFSFPRVIYELSSTLSTIASAEHGR